MARTLALDIGNRRIGVAVSDTTRSIARPLEVIDRHRQNALQRIVELVRQLQPDNIVVGYPLNADGSVGAQALKVERFVQLVRLNIECPVVYYDERYSTSEAQDIMGAKRRKDRQQHDDAIAAAVILQRYLNEVQHSISEHHATETNILASDESRM